VYTLLGLQSLYDVNKLYDWRNEYHINEIVKDLQKTIDVSRVSKESFVTQFCVSFVAQFCVSFVTLLCGYI
jgi:hypothetical protein